MRLKFETLMDRDDPNVKIGNILTMHFSGDEKEKRVITKIKGDMITTRPYYGVLPFLKKMYFKIFKPKYRRISYGRYGKVVSQVPSIPKRIWDFIDTKVLKWNSWKKLCDDLHHAPVCPANHYHYMQRPYGPCLCGADTRKDLRKWNGFLTDKMIKEKMEQTW